MAITKTEFIDRMAKKGGITNRSEQESRCIH